MERRHRHLRAAAVAWLLILGGLVACSIPPPPARQPFRATDHFQGQALELAQAVDRKDAAAIRHLIKDEGVNPDTIFDQANMPMVAWPIINQNFDGLRLLLDNGANPNARKMMPLRERGKAGEDNALVFAAGLPDQRYLKLLLDRGGDPNTMSSNDEQLTYVATLHHVWPNVQLLIERGANINQPLYTTDGYNTVLNWYTKYADFEQAYWLLQHGADPTRKIKADPGTPNYGRMPMVEDIYYAPVRPDGVAWQRKCQHWLRDHGIQRTPEMGVWGDYRKKLGVASDPKDIPLL
ncbi:ankyrin repeat domain-containing protein [Rhodanobacter sp. UC4450_H17]